MSQSVKIDICIWKFYKAREQEAIHMRLVEEVMVRAGSAPTRMKYSP